MLYTYFMILMCIVEPEDDDDIDYDDIEEDGETDDEDTAGKIY